MKLIEWLFGNGDREDDSGQAGEPEPESTLGVHIVRYVSETFSEVSLTEQDLQLLTVVGLPDSAAPFLSFHQEPAMIPWAQADGQIPIELGHLVEIGSDGSGDPICVTTNGHVIKLNHGNGFEAMFMNSSVCLLAEFLETYRILWEKVRPPDSGRGQDHACVENTLRFATEELREKDPPAIVQDTFWQDALFEIGNQT
jgi:SUKH-4 immunity protein